MRLAALSAVALVLLPQQRLADLPRYERYQRMSRESRGALVSGAVAVAWDPSGGAFEYTRNGQAYRFSVADAKATPIPALTLRPGGGRGRFGGPGRGRQNASVTSPDGKRTAESRDRNVVVTEGGKTTPITTDGSVEARVKYGVASWVYGEELEVKDAMWWSPDSSRLAFYRFDEKPVKDYYVAEGQGQVQDTLAVEAYPKAGANNPKVSLIVRNFDDGSTTVVPINEGEGAWEYAYDVRWSPDGKLLLFNRTNRKQNVMQFVAADPMTGTCRVIAEERQPQSWAENHPTEQFLADGKRFVWSTERNGYVNFDLRSLDGTLVNPITHNDFDALRATFYEGGQQGIVRIDEKAGEMFYMAAGPQNPYHQQLHVVGLDGKNDRLLTDPVLGHRVSLSPDGKTFVDVAQSSTVPPETRVVDRRGKVLATISKSDTSRIDALKLRPTEVFTYPAADGKTTLYGTIGFPSDFDPSKRYPILLDVYGGPESGGIDAGYSLPKPTAELGFLVVNLAGRGTMGRGKAFRDAVYGKLGTVEMDDQAAGIQTLGKRPYVDLKRVGVEGTSYGGYSTLMLLLRHPETFAAGAASSAVTDFRNYDSTYTERYMGLPQDNAAGYDAGSAVVHAGDLKGRLMIYFGSADDNVHPANAYQFVQALGRAGGRYEMQVGTDRGHSAMNEARMLEFFTEALGAGK